MDTNLYPLKFLPLFKNKIWGGNKIKELGFDYAPLPNCGEMWVLSAVPGNESVVSNGFLAENSLDEVLEIYMGELLGEKNYERFGNQFPLLIKIIDANDKLSIQVHPDDHLARQRGMDCGKTEMWYIMDAEKGAEIVDGFDLDLTIDDYKKVVELGRLERVLHVEHPEPGDVFFIPAGRVHALGSGLLLAEIQQSSDCTYRIYDYNRLGDDGKPRQLHTEEALDAIDYSQLKDGKTHYQQRVNATNTLAECPYFTTNLIPLDKPMRKDFSQLDSFVVYLCTQGIAAIKAMDTITPIHAGECVLLPAIVDTVELFSQGPAQLLEVYIDPDQYQGEYTHANDLDWVARFMGETELDDVIEKMDLDYEDHSDHCDCGHHHHDDHCDCGHHHDDDCGCGHHHDDDCGHRH